MSTSWMLERLDWETRPHHAGAESDFTALLRTDTTPSDYLTFLVRVYGFDASLESTLAMTPDLVRVIDLKERAKAGYVAQDMMALGLRPNQIAELPQCLAIPQFRGAPEALGWMYVVERSTLAHGIVCRQLQARLPQQMSNASSYLSCYAGVVGARWRSFGTTLDRIAGTPRIAERVVIAANDAFRCQRRWIRQDINDIRVAI